jgi:arylsulfatase
MKYRKAVTFTILIYICAAAVHADELTPTIKNTMSRPNIILIMADDMGWSDLGYYGGEIQTPNIDRR